MTNLSYLYFKQNNFKEALDIGTESLKIRKEQKEIQNETLIDVINFLCEICEKKGEKKENFEELINLYMEKMSILEKFKNFKEYGKSIADCYMKIGEYQENMSDFINALKSYEESFKIYKKVLEINPEEEGDLILGDLKNLIGQLCVANKEYEKAEKEFLEAISIFEKHFDKDDPIILEINENIKIVKNQRKNQKAKSFKLF